MKRPDRTGRFRKAAVLAVIAIFLLAGAPLSATESDLKAKPAETEKPQVEADAETPDTAVCIDADAGQTTANAGVNTLEDIYSISQGNIAALLKLTAESQAGNKPAGQEVRWTEVEAKTVPSQAEPEKDKD